MRLGDNLHQSRAGTVQVDEDVGPDGLGLCRVLLDLELVDPDCERALDAGFGGCEGDLAVARDGVWELESM
jgi:hypothetical protein